MVKARKGSGKRNWARGMFALFWVMLAGFSGLYLFQVFTDPTALQAAQLAPSVTAAPASSAPVVAQAPAPSMAFRENSQELSEIKSSLRTVSQQIEELNTRLKPIEKFIGPVAALPGSVSVSAPMEAPAPPQAEPEAAPAPEPVVEQPTPEPTPPEQAGAEPAPPSAGPVEAPVPAEEPVAEASPAPTEEPTPETVPAPAEDSAPPAAEAAPSAAEAFDSANLSPTDLPETANDGTTRYGIEIGSVGKRDQLRPLWREFLTNHAALVAGLQPRRVLAPDKKWRLIAGPFASPDEAKGACSLFKKADRPCEATVYAGDAL